MFFLNPKSEAASEQKETQKRFLKLTVLSAALVFAFRGIAKLVRKD
jgi:hypothetical protein